MPCVVIYTLAEWLAENEPSSTMYFDQPIASSPSLFESSSFQDWESSSLQNQEPSVLQTHEDPLHSHEPTPSLSSSFYQQTTPPSFYQQQWYALHRDERESVQNTKQGSSASGKTLKHLTLTHYHTHTLSQSRYKSSGPLILKNITCVLKSLNSIV